MTPKTTTERVANLRRRRSEAGLVRVEVYAHQDDVEAIREAARKLARKRDKVQRLVDELRIATPRNAFQCAARGCEGCSVCKGS